MLLCVESGTQGNRGAQANPPGKTLGGRSTPNSLPQFHTLLLSPQGVEDAFVLLPAPDSSLVLHSSTSSHPSIIPGC